MKNLSQIGLKHIAIILDGNRRWAKSKGLLPNQGHKQGANRLEDIINYAYDIGLPYLTVYAFSTENWQRDSIEIDAIMKLLYEFTKKEVDREDTRDVCIKVYGNKNKLSQKIKNNLDILEQRTKDRKRLTFGICLDYGGRQEIAYAIKQILTKLEKNELSIDEITEDVISNSLYTAGIPDPDLMIRTSGEYRTSGFLTFQSAYSELYFTNTYWPDFTTNDLDEAILEYEKRQRRFGK